MIRLVQEFGAQAGRSFDFQKDRVRVGRAPDNDVVFDAHLDLDASGRHCELVLAQGVWTVIDQNARNGTWVNGMRVQSRPLAHGDVIECGRSGPRLRVEFPPAPPPQPQLPPAYGPVVVAANPAAPPVSVGQNVAAAMPPGAKVGHRTVAFMIDQALAQNAKRQRGLKFAVVALTALVVLGFALGAWLILDGERDRRDAPPADANVGARIARENERAIYLLAWQTPGRPPRGFCTGFAVTDRMIATNAHCVQVAVREQGRGARVVALPNKREGVAVAVAPAFVDARYQNAQLSRGGIGYDVGLVRAAEALPAWVNLASDEELFALHEGDGIFVYGFPGLTMNEASPVATITLGLLNRVTDFRDNVATPQTAQKLQHSAQTAGGSSGSPIFLPSGRVIGLNAGSLADDERQIVIDPNNGQRREVEVNRSSNFKYGMRADLIRQALAAVPR